MPSSVELEMNMPALYHRLKRMVEASPSARYFNVDVARYQLRNLAGAKSAPLQVVTFWKKVDTNLNLKIDYKYNGNALSKPEPLKNVTFSVNADVNSLYVDTQPPAQWYEFTCLILKHWRPLYIMQY